jgi:hypothetical protein
MLLAACGTEHAAGDAAKAGTGPSASADAPTSLREAALYDGGSGAFVVADGSLYRDADGRGQFRSHLPAGASQAIAVDGNVGRIATVSVGNGSLTIDESSDNGASFARRGQASTAGLSPVGFRTATIAAHGGRVVVSAQEATNANFASGIAFVSQPGRSDWTTSALPAAGALTYAGSQFLLLAGPDGKRLYGSGDGSAWRNITPPGLTGEYVLGTPATSDAGLVVPVTQRTDAGSDVVFYFSADGGGSWSARDHVQTSAVVESDVPLPTAVHGTSWAVAVPDGSRVYAGDLSRPGTTTISPNGLPRGVSQLVFSGPARLLVTVAATTCANGKDSCATATRLYSSDDAGQTWREYVLTP